MLSDAQLALSAGLVVLIWLIQLLHYPSFHFFDPRSFSTAMAFHQARISLVVVPLMLGELALTSWVTYQSPSSSNLAIFACVAGVWISTFVLQVPLHHQLVAYTPETINRLVLTNWIRTALWTIKLVIVLYSLPVRPQA